MGRLRKTFILYINWLIMTETRKAIIELIELFMNKTLCEWCLFIDDLWNYYTYDNKLPKWLIRKIIGYYDITAVLKYFLPKYVISNYNNKEIFINDTWIPESRELWWIIPNKPLHLYTEKEEKDLLKLLLKLK